MPKFLNEWDIHMLTDRHKGKPVLFRGMRILNRLVALVNGVSDGWAYWKAPVTAAAKLMELVDDRDRRGDVTEAELEKTLTPIKSFLTRQARQLKGNTIQFD